MSEGSREEYCGRIGGNVYMRKDRPCPECGTWDTHTLSSELRVERDDAQVRLAKSEDERDQLKARVAELEAHSRFLSNHSGEWEGMALQWKAGLDAKTAQVDAYEKATTEHLESAYTLWDNGLIEHTDECLARREEIYDEDCDCGAVALVNGDAFKAARALDAKEGGQR